jgi:hypothetical protein
LLHERYAVDTVSRRLCDLYEACWQGQRAHQRVGVR